MSEPAADLKAKRIDFALEEFKSLRVELATIYEKQQKHILEAFVIIGALVTFFFANLGNGNIEKKLLFFVPAVFIPFSVCCTIVQSLAMFLRQCKLQKYMTYLKIQYSDPISCEEGEQYYSWSHWYDLEGTSILHRGDVGAGIIALSLFALIMVYVAHTLCGITFRSGHSWLCFGIVIISATITAVYAQFVTREYLTRYHNDMASLGKEAPRDQDDTITNS